MKSPQNIDNFSAGGGYDAAVIKGLKKPADFSHIYESEVIIMRGEWLWLLTAMFVVLALCVALSLQFLRRRGL
jgi:hypothetical protein